MARLSEALIGAMARPSYSGMLSSAVGGSFQGISDAYDQRRSRQAQESAQAMLTGGDVADPRVQQSIQAVYSQMNQDPAQAQELIKAAQVEKRAAAQETRVEAAFKDQQAYNKIRMDALKEAEDGKKARAIALEKYQRGGSAKDIVDSMPQQFREEAMAAITAQEKFVNDMSTYKEAAEGREAFDEDTISAIKATPGMENSVAAYEKMKKTHPQAAKKILLKQWETAHAATLRTVRQSRPVNLPSATIKRNMEYIDTLDTKAWGLPIFGKGLRHTVDTIPEDLKLAVATEMARRERDDPNFDPTPDAVKSIANELGAKIADDKSKGGDKAEEAAIPADVLEAFPNAFVENGEIFVMIDGQKNRIKTQ